MANNPTTFDRVRASSIEVFEPLTVKGETSFKEVRTAEFSPLIELDSSNGLSTVYRDKVNTTNSGSVTESTDGGFKVSTGTTSTSTAELSTQERGRYQPGIVAVPGIGIRRPTAPTGNQEIQWGYFDNTDGFYFGEDSTGVFVQYLHGGTLEDKVYQEDWNGDDRLDGKGGSKNPSEVELDLTKVNVYRPEVTWYGGGPAEMNVLTTDSKGNPVNKTVHRFSTPSDEPLLSQPKLPVTAKSDNGGDTTNIDMYVYGRQFAVLGRYDPNRRETAASRVNASISGTPKPMITFKKKTNRQDKAKSVKVSGLGGFADVNGLVTVILGGTLSAGTTTFTAIDGIATTETALEVNTTATEITGGTIIDKTLFAGSFFNSNFSGIRRLGLDIPDETNVSVVFESLGGVGTASSVFSLEEEH